MKESPEAENPRRRPSIRSRKSRVEVRDLAELPEDFSWFENLRGMIPSILRGKDIEELAGRVAAARRSDRPVVVMLGAHVVKCGLGRVVGGAIRRGVITAVAMNGACAIHDVELARWGKTSEDVEEGLRRGDFGMAVETSEFFDRAAATCLREDIGLGEAIGSNLAAGDAPHRDVSIIAAAHASEVPVTVHVAIGTDIVHQHAEADGKAIGHGTMKDFRRFSSIVAGLRGGVILNIGSAVILPEVFLKALAMARSSGADMGNFTAANFDMHSLYRPSANILRRPRELGATTYGFLGHHELLLPVFFASVLAKLHS